MRRVLDGITAAACVAIVMLGIWAAYWIVSTQERESYIRGCERSGGTYLECRRMWDRRDQ